MADYSSLESPTLDAFHQDNSFLRAIMGPVGSGKSVACSVEAVLRANRQKPLSGSKVRPSKFAVVRNTYGELRDTTEATFFQWIPPEWGHWKSSEHTFTAQWPHQSGDGTTVEMEIIFRALDRPKDVRKLLSLELTGCWFNEAREIPWGIVDVMQTRVGRFPPKKQGGASWFGIWLDTNPPDNDSKFYHVFEELRPEGYKLFRQPGGRDPNAENVQNLVDGYYDRLVAGKSDDFVQVYVDAEYGFVSDGRPVWPEYVDRTHASDVPYSPCTREDICVGIDFGVTPAAAFAQRTATGQIVFFDELVADYMGAEQFAAELNRLVSAKYSEHDIQFFCDPAGRNPSEADLRRLSR